MRTMSWVSLALLAACSQDFSIGDRDRLQGSGDKPDLSTPTKTDVITQVTKPEVDILWVIDNSGSMLDEQAKLAENFPNFMNFFLESGLDYHIAVTSTDTTATGLNGRLRAVGSYRYVTPDVADPVGVFQTMARLGANGSADENPSLAAYRAVAQPTPALQSSNQGFYRENASFHVIVVTDEPDSSFGTGFSVGEFINWMNTLKGDEDIPVSFSAIAGRVPNYPYEDGNTSLSGCPDTDGDGWPDADPGIPFAQISEAVGRRDVNGRAAGRLFPICESKWDKLLEDLGLLASALRREYFLTEVPVPGTITVLVRTPDGAVVEGIDREVLPADYTPKDVLDACEELGAASCFDFYYDAPRNSIVLPTYVPPPQSQIRVRYELLSGKENDDGFSFGGDTDAE